MEPKEVVVASGKGGTGKTFVAANLAYYLALAKGIPLVAVDADAEAPDLLLALGGPKERLRERVGVWGLKARIDYQRCTRCLSCARVCAFHAIEIRGTLPVVVEEYCEGCGACTVVCPSSSITFEKKPLGTVRVDVSRYGIMVVTAELEIGARGSGELVYEAKKEAAEIAKTASCRLVLVDAAAGIGCAVISSLAGADFLLLVCEPTQSSLQGARRLLEVADKFGLKTLALINKWDLNPDMSSEIRRELGVDVLGLIPYDPAVPESYARMAPLLAYAPESRASKALVDAFERVVRVIGS